VTSCVTSTVLLLSKTKLRLLSLVGTIQPDIINVQLTLAAGLWIISITETNTKAVDTAQVHAEVYKPLQRDFPLRPGIYL